MDKITKAENTSNVFTAPLEAQMNQIKMFNKYLINLALQKDYKIERIDVKKARKLNEQQLKSSGGVNQNTSQDGDKEPISDKLGMVAGE